MPNSYVESKRKAHIQEFFNYIFKHGLVAADTTYTSRFKLGSFDANPLLKICYFLVTGNQLNQASSSTATFWQKAMSFDPATTLASDQLESWQHKGVDGLWSLCMERDYLLTNPKKEKSADLAEWDDRLMSSIILICNPEGINGKDLSPIATSLGSPILDKNTDCIPVANMDAILAPANYVSACASFPQKDRIHTIDQITKYMSMARLPQTHLCLTCPDYVKKLKNLLQKKPLVILLLYILNVYPPAEIFYVLLL